MALEYFAYNFVKIHRTLRLTPAMAAGVTARLWEVADLVLHGKPKNGSSKERHRPCVYRGQCAICVCLANFGSALNVR